MPINSPIPVKSTWVKSIQYQSGMLTVETKHGKRYTFVAVPEDLWRQLEASDSKGRFINDKIKGRYKQAWDGHSFPANSTKRHSSRIKN